MLEFFRGGLKLLDDKLISVSSDASAIILFVVAAGMLGLIFLVATRALPEKQSPLPRTKIDPIDDADVSSRTVAKLKKAIEVLNEDIDHRDTKIKNLRDSQEHTPVERLYFAVNGIVNSEFILGIGLVLWEFLDLRNRPPKQIVLSAVAQELGRVMSVLAATTICSAIIVYITRSEDGRSYQKINRAFYISLGISVAAFLVFTLFVPDPFQ